MKPDDERSRDVKAALDAVRRGCDVARRREADPVGFAHRYDAGADRELVALVSACVAFGNVKAIRAKLDDLLERLGPRPAVACDAPAALRARLRGWKHRVFQGDDIAKLLAGARRVQREHGSLGALFRAELARQGTLREALAVWCDAIREAGGLRRDGERRGPAHLLPDPRGPSGSKRLLLFLRWMVRPADGVDLGLWDVDPALLLVPVDVHIHRLARNLGFTRRRDLSWRTTEEITAALARFDARDPVSYDFSLCHMGMLQRCPSRRDERRCEGCGVQPVCIHWAPRKGGGSRATSSRRSAGTEGSAKVAGPRE
ncbi:MAG TPA: TIGR02757 family protein [Polyangiaceae bacterium]|nr:TIGR02757 family protein [Polyangiaceae bacterium]